MKARGVIRPSQRPDNVVACFWGSSPPGGVADFRLAAVQSRLALV